MFWGSGRAFWRGKEQKRRKMRPPWCTPLKEQQNRSFTTERQRWIRGIKKRFRNNRGNKPKLSWEGENPVCRAPSGGQEDSLWGLGHNTNSPKRGKFMKTWNVRMGEPWETISRALWLPDEEYCPDLRVPCPYLAVPFSASERWHLRHASSIPLEKDVSFFLNKEFYSTV